MNLDQIIRMIETCNDKGAKRESTLRPYLIYFTPMLINKTVYSNNKHIWIHIADEIYLQDDKNESCKKDKIPDALFYDKTTKTLNFIEYKTEYIKDNVNNEYKEIKYNKKKYSNMYINHKRLDYIKNYCIDFKTKKIKKNLNFKVEEKKQEIFKKNGVKNIYYYNICYFVDGIANKGFYFIQGCGIIRNNKKEYIIKDGLLRYYNYYYNKFNIEYLKCFDKMNLIKFCLNIWKESGGEGESAISPYFTYLFYRYFGEEKLIKKYGIEINYNESNNGKCKGDARCQADIGMLTHKNDLIIFEIKMNNIKNECQNDNYKKFLEYINTDDSINAYVNVESSKEFDKTNIKLIKNVCKYKANDRNKKILGLDQKMVEQNKINKVLLIKVSKVEKPNIDLKEEILGKLDYINKEYDACNILKNSIIEISFNNIIEIIQKNKLYKNDEIIQYLTETLKDICQ